MTTAAPKGGGISGSESAGRPSPILAPPGLLVWERHLIDAGLRLGPLPLYGSKDWLALADRDRRKVGSAVRAAAAWRLDGVHLEQRLRDEIAAARAVYQVEEHAISEALDGRVARIVQAHMNLPTQAQLTTWGLARDLDRPPALPPELLTPAERRRWSIPDPVRADPATPRPGDHPGGPVAWERS